MKIIFYTDGHLKVSKPISRKEETNLEYVEHQIDIRKEMFSYAKANKIRLILNGGDYFDSWKGDGFPLLVSKLIPIYGECCFEEFVCMGNHDLPNHNKTFLDKSCLGALKNLEFVEIKNTLQRENVTIDFFHYGDELARPASDKKGYRIAVLHENIFKTAVPPYMSGYTVNNLIAELPDYDLYLCGHNHEKFIKKTKGKVVINGGSFGRTIATQKKFKPAFWEIDTDEGTFIEHKVKVGDYISDEHLYKNGISEGAFVEKVKNLDIQAYDFDTYVENKLKREKVVDKVKEIVYSCTE